MESEFSEKQLEFRIFLYIRKQTPKESEFSEKQLAFRIFLYIFEIAKLYYLLNINKNNQI
jgi:hypothetical protein